MPQTGSLPRPFDPLPVLSSTNIKKLKKRLDLTTWPCADVDFPYDTAAGQREAGVHDGLPWGATHDQVRGLYEEWRDWDFAAWQQDVCALPHYKIQLSSGGEELDLHFVHIAGSRTAPDIDAKHRAGAPLAEKPALLLIHGWPGSFLEFKDIIPVLGQKFNLVIPSLPGFAFSSAPTKPGFGIKQVAAALDQLMLILGYSSYVCQGGDWGGLVCRALGIYHPSSCKQIHVNFSPSFPSRIKIWHALQVASALCSTHWLSFLLGHSRQDVTTIKRLGYFLVFGAGYQWIQATKPQTLAYALSDSPVGLLAWLHEKFYSWSGNHGRRGTLGSSAVLGHASLYYLTNSIGSSMRIYKEHIMSGELFEMGFQYCATPTCVSVFEGDIMNVPMNWVRHRYRVVWHRHHARGGHFAALERGEVLARDVVECVDGYLEGRWKPSPVYRQTEWIAGFAVGVAGSLLALWLASPL
ncbi:epoxide hydrolase [Kappamyces sp. JEL0829]|nr:epoxide hydrolase [Kappamyces sp. JEL0829]